MRVLILNKGKRLNVLDSARIIVPHLHASWEHSLAGGAALPAVVTCIITASFFNLNLEYYNLHNHTKDFKMVNLTP